MKIITRLSNKDLQHIYDNYNFDNMLLVYPDCYPYIVVPKILSLGNIELSEHNACFTDKDGYVYSRSHAEKHLLQFTGLTIQELFDLTVLHINDTEDRPKCAHPDCNEPLKWSGRFTAGYGSGGHPWDESDFHFCCRGCAADYQYTHREDYPLTKHYLDNGGTFGLMLSDKVNYDWTLMSLKSRRTNFINQGNPDDICYLYVTWTSTGEFKFGITSDPDTRMLCSNMVNKYSNIHIVKKDSRLKIAEFEYQIKLRLNQSSEYLSGSMISDFWKILKSL